MKIHFYQPSLLRHIEKFSLRRVAWLHDKIISDGVWIKPLALCQNYGLVLDGQHRMEVALRMGLTKVPVVLFDYQTVALRSLRNKYQFDWQQVTHKALSGDLYPYKTVKHDFTSPLPHCHFALTELGYHG